MQQESKDNFCPMSLKDHPKKSRKQGPAQQMSTGTPAGTPAAAGPLCRLSAGTLDPFQAFAVDMSRLQVLLGDCKSSVKYLYSKLMNGRQS